MFCRFCGREMADESRFCRFCGKALEEGAQKTPEAPAAPKPKPMRNKLLYEGGRASVAPRIFGFVFVAILALAFLGAAGWCFYVLLTYGLGLGGWDSSFSEGIYDYVSFLMDGNAEMAFFADSALFSLLGVLLIVKGIGGILFYANTYVNVYEDRVEGVAGTMLIPKRCVPFSIPRKEILRAECHKRVLIITAKNGTSYRVATESAERATQLYEFLQRVPAHRLDE